MEQTNIPIKGVLTREARILVRCSQQAAFEFISSSEELPRWLKSLGPIPGAEKVDVIEGPYDHVGARREIHFDKGNIATEQLIRRDPYANYAYEISHFNQLFGKLTNAAYGELWFDIVDNQTRITWKYTFTYRSFFARILLSLILSLYYTRFLKQALRNAAEILNAEGESV